MKNYFFGWANIKTVLIDIYETLMAKKSKLSSKRLITFAANNSLILLTWIFVVYMLHYKTLSAMDFIIATGPLLIMGGYSLTKSEDAKKDKPKELPNE